MTIETKQDLEEAIARLTRRTPESLATFIVSHAQDVGPIGEHVRTFIVADNRAETIALLEERIASLTQSARRNWRHQAGEHVGERLGYILDTIETAVLAADPRDAFRLLVLLIESDGRAMERCGDHHDSVGSAFNRAAELMAQATSSVPIPEVLPTLKRLIAEDGYGTRRSLVSVADAVAAAGERLDGSCGP
jgi:hypothetical protein